MLQVSWKNVCLVVANFCEARSANYQFPVADPSSLYLSVSILNLTIKSSHISRFLLVCFNKLERFFISANQ